MDPCTLAVQVLSACTSETATAIKTGPYPTAITEQANKNLGSGPSAGTTNPEAFSLPELMGASDCASRGAAHKPKISCEASPETVPPGPATSPGSLQANAMPTRPTHAGPRPVNGDQLFAFRRAALGAGEMYTRTTPQRYQAQWLRGLNRASYEQWKGLLAQEAAVMAQSQGGNRLTVLVGDSLSLWLPMEQLPRHQFWLNQSISGETTGQILSRLHYFRATRPHQIHVMAGINDLRNGASDAEVVRNTQQILVRLRQQHPQAQLVIYSILPTRLGSLPSDRISRVNDYIAYVANQQGAQFVDLQSTFADPQGLLRRDLTTDGLHLSRQGYEVWQTALVGI